jgi:2-methylcitrate dehydratase PrpD
MSAPTRTFAEFVAGLRPEHIPPEVRARCVAYLLDNIGVATVGARQPVHGSVRRALLTSSGIGSAPLIGSSETLPLAAATFLNGVAVGDFEYEHIGHHSHPAASVFPAVFDLGASLERSGSDLLTAMIAGYEVAARIGRASTGTVESDRGFHNPGINGTLAAAAASAWLLGLDAQQTASALGIAASNSAGLMAFTTTGALTKRLHPGRAGQLGLESALLSARGVTGPEDVLENPLGYFHAFTPAPQLDDLLDDLGTEWIGNRMIVKLTPVHAHALPFVHAIGNHFKGQPRPDPEDVVDIRVVAGPKPQQRRHLNAHPASLLEAQYSVRFCIAAAIVEDFRSPLRFNQDLALRKDVARLAERVSFELDPEISDGGMLMLGTEVIDARSYPAPVTPGDLWDLIDDKFTASTAQLLAADVQDHIRAAVARLDGAPNIGGLTDLVARAAVPAKD